VTGIKPKTRHVAHTSLMGVARVGLAIVSHLRLSRISRIFRLALSTTPPFQSSRHVSLIAATVRSILRGVLKKCGDTRRLLPPPWTPADLFVERRRELLSIHRMLESHRRERS